MKRGWYQQDIKVIQRKVLTGTHLPITIKEIQAFIYLSIFPIYLSIYLCLSIICLYLTQNKLPNTKTAIQKVETLAEKILIIRFLII